MPSTLSLAVVGVHHPNRGKMPPRKFAIDLCRPGDPVQLILEPTNPKDERAVVVLNRHGMMMGYVTAERCGMVKRKIEDGADVRAIFQAAASYGAIIRVSFNGSDPALPPAAAERYEPAQQTDSEWWPDETYDD